MSANSRTFPKDTTLVYYIKYDVLHLELPTDDYEDQFWLGAQAFHPTNGEFHTIIMDGRSIQEILGEVSQTLEGHYPGIWSIVCKFFGEALRRMVDPVKIPRFGHQCLPTSTHVDLIHGPGGLQMIGQVPGGVTTLVVNKTSWAPDRREVLNIGGMYYQDAYTLLENAFHIFQIQFDHWCIKSLLDRLFRYVEEVHRKGSMVPSRIPPTYKWRLYDM